MSGNHSASDVSCPAKAQLRPAPPCSTASPSSSLNRPVSSSSPGRLSGGGQTQCSTPVQEEPTGVMEEASGGAPEVSPEDALTASVVTAERPRLLVEVSSPSGGGSARSQRDSIRRPYQTYQISLPNTKHCLPNTKYHVLLKGTI